MKRYSVCEANLQDEFPNTRDGSGSIVGGKIFQLEFYPTPQEAATIVAWFTDQHLALKAARLLNKAI